MDLKQYLDSLDVTVSLKLTNKCPLECTHLTQLDKEEFNTYPRMTHIHGRVYTLSFNRPSKKMVSTYYVTSYDQESNYPFYKILVDTGDDPEVMNYKLQANNLKDYHSVSSFREVWYGRSNKRYAFMQFVAGFRWHLLNDLRRAYDIFDWNKILQNVSFVAPPTFADYTAIVDWNTHKNLMFGYDRAIKEGRKFLKFFSQTELKRITNLRQNP